MRKETEAAYVARIMRAELKDKFPKTKFRVRCENFSMGNSVDVDWTKTYSSPTEKEVYAVIKKYQAGHFDGMTDSYEYSNKTDGPTVKYVFANEHYPQEVIDAVHARISRNAYPEEYRTAYAEEFERYVSTH